MEVENKIYKKGTFTARAVAFIIDGIILVIINSFLENVVSGRILNLLISGFITILYGSLFLWKYGQTPGKKIMRLKVVDTNYQPLSLKKAVLRESVGKSISNITFELGYLWVLINNKRQAWHDKLAKTYVVKTDSLGQFIPLTQEEKVTILQKLFFGILVSIFTLPITFFIFLVIVYLFIAMPVQIKGQAMTPNFIDGQYYFVSKNAYAKTSPKRGDVIVYKYPANSDLEYIKRIIGIPGDTILLHNGKIYLNGTVFNENSYLPAGINTYSGAFLKEDKLITVPSNDYFVLGDNRLHSSDSRDFGLLSKQDIIGKISFCYWNCTSH